MVETGGLENRCASKGHRGFESLFLRCRFRPFARITRSSPTGRLNLLAAEAYRRELLSEGQLARLLDLDRVEVREILDSFDSDQNEADGIIADRHE